VGGCEKKLAMTLDGKSQAAMNFVLARTQLLETT
jgi:hypothetical protein